MTPEILGVLRHILTVLGGVLVTKGHLGEADLEILAGAAVTLVGIGWSIYAKRKQPT